jgi:hypothetical protein
MAISFILNDEAVNDQTTGLQTGDNIDDVFTDTDVAYASLPAAFRTYLETTLSSTFPDQRRCRDQGEHGHRQCDRRQLPYGHHVHGRGWRRPHRRPGDG